MNGAWPWLAVALLGAYHGVDPSMGWLFAVGLGLQDRSRKRVFAALVPIAIGHLLSVAAVVALIAAAMGRGFVWLRPLGAVILIGFGIFRLRRPLAHPRWVAMRVGFGDLTLWSFLMATAHGAGLMLFPILMAIPAGGAPPMPHHHMPMPPPVGHLGPLAAGAVIVLHTSAMLLVMGSVAIAVYEWIGLKILRSAWINLDTIWAIALIAAGLLSLAI